MPSKGLDLYAANLSGGIQNSFTVKQPGASSATPYTFPADGTIHSTHVEIDYSSRHPFSFSGDLTLLGGSDFKRSCEISSISGNVSDSDMNDMLGNQQMQSFADGVVSYGFYDAGSGYGGVSYTSHHQCYAYSGDSNRATWMATLVAASPDLANKPFSTFVLPGAHDSGMNTSTNIADMAQRVQGSSILISGLAQWIVAIILFPIAGLLQILISAITLLGIVQIKQLLINLAITQKDSFADMLSMGVRYFDFRPGYNAKIGGIQVAPGDGLYHQHTLIPGAKFDDFLTDVVGWLHDHPGEIVVVNLNFSGFRDHEAMNPTTSTLQTAITNAIGTSGIQTGDISDAARSYTDLINSNTRLLFFNQGVGFSEATKNDSYSDGAYGQFQPDQILTALAQMPQTPPAGDLYTVLQLQGTATAAFSSKSDWTKLITASSPATSPLLMTKARFDQATYAWASGALGQFDSRYPLVILNDFVDPLMSEMAQAATVQRATQTHYTLTLPGGTITLADGVYAGSVTTGQWSPYPPATVGGLKDGDTVTACCTFALSPDVSPLPPGADYLGLSIGACSSSNTAGLSAMQAQASAITSGSADSAGILLGSALSTHSTPTNADLFYGVTSQENASQTLPGNRGSLAACVYQWSMTYNGSNTVAHNGQDVTLVYAYSLQQTGTAST